MLEMKTWYNDATTNFQTFRDASHAQTGELHNYTTGEFIRIATAGEQAASIAAAETDGGSGVIVVDGVSCYVED